MRKTLSQRPVLDTLKAQLTSTSMLSRAAVAAMAFVAFSANPTHAVTASAASTGAAAAASAPATVSSPAVLIPPPAVLPTGGTVVFGGVTISIDLFHQIMTILQTTNSSIINWDSFNISADGTVTFIMPDGGIALNRVVGGNLSEIFGKLSSNGIIFLINPNGVVFGANANINVGGLVASTANITDANFLAGTATGNFNFNGVGNPGASIINQGNINSAGLVLLVAPQVGNSGIIQAKSVVLGSGNAFAVDFFGDNLINFQLTQAADANVNPNAGVDNSGIISATGGNVLLTANVAGNIVNNVINNTGLVEATRVSSEGGDVIILGGPDGSVNVGGTVIADNNIDINGGGNVNFNAAIVDAGNNLTVNANGDINADASALRGGRNVKLTADNITLANATRVRAGRDVNITIPGWLTLLGDSRIGAGRDLNSLNRHLYSDTAGVFSAGRSITLYQGDLGSIQNAIDAFGYSGNLATLKLHSGVWTENVVINRDRTVLEGSPIGTSTINAAGPGSVISVDASTVTIRGVDIDGLGLAANGIEINDSRAVTVSGNNIRNTKRSAVSIANSNGVTVNRNVISDNNTFGVYADNIDNLRVTGNRMSQGAIGVQIQDSNGALVERNSFTNFFQGVVARGSDALRVLTNSFRSISGTAVSVTDGNNATVSDNDINGARNGITLTNASDSVVDNNTLRTARNGITTDRSSNLAITNNDIRAGMTGISVNRTAGSLIANNTVIGSARHGILLTNSGNTTISGNLLQNNFSGLTADNTNGLRILGNTFVRNQTGASLAGSNNALFDGGVFTNNGTGIVLDDSDNARLDNLTINSAVGGTGIIFRNGSGNALVRNLALNGGRVGVIVDGAGSSMQFADSNSRFTGMSTYFELRNGAMNGEVLDASQQTFDGVRAFDFTPGQLGAAEGRTTDGEDSAFFGFIGDVFYKFFDDTPPPPPPPANLAALNEFDRDRSGAARELYSYAGLTIDRRTLATGNVYEGGQAQRGFNFELAELNLSLLNPAAGGINAPQAVSLAGLTPEQLATLTPAAGNAEGLAALAPAAGGLPAAPDCGTSFLDSGFNPAFNTATCSLQQ